MKSKPLIGAGLMLVSAGSGCLDVLSYRFLGQAFPSAMTGNLALLGRSLGEADLPAAAHNICAFGGFFAGAFLGAALLRGTPGKRRFLTTLALETLLLIYVAVGWDPFAVGLPRFELIAAAALGMGMQSAVANRIGVHAVSTTYFSGTTANIAFGLAGRKRPRQVGWPFLALCSYLTGAASAGWSITGGTIPGSPIGLQTLPAFAAAALWLAIAVVRLDGTRTA